MRQLAVNVLRRALVCAAVCAAGSAHAELPDLLDFDAPGHWRAAVAPYMKHLYPKPEHEYVWAIIIERQRDDRWLYGASYFSNSFGQASGYAYLGYQFQQLFDVQPLYLQLTAGLIYGYTGEYQDRVPYNHAGFSPGIVPSLGWQFDKRFGAQLNYIGAAGLMIQFCYTLP